MTNLQVPHWVSEHSIGLDGVLHVVMDNLVDHRGEDIVEYVPSKSVSDRGEDLCMIYHALSPTGGGVGDRVAL